MLMAMCYLVHVAIIYLLVRAPRCAHVEDKMELANWGVSYLRHLIVLVLSSILGAYA